MLLIRDAIAIGGKYKLSDRKVIKKKLFILMTTKDIPCFIVTAPQRVLSGFSILGWWKDVKMIAFPNEGGFPMVAIRRMPSVYAALTEINLLKDELGIQVDDEIKSAARQQKLKLFQKIYCIAYSKKKIGGWAMVFNYKDYISLTQTVDGQFFMSCKSAAFTFEEIEEANTFMTNEITLLETESKHSKRRKLKNKLLMHHKTLTMKMPK